MEAPILVTGAAGFIGFHVARGLAAAGRSVLGIDNLNACRGMSAFDRLGDSSRKHPTELARGRLEIRHSEPIIQRATVLQEVCRQ
jgi:nucleoside-diphosphate-sugar epimerase